jgi:hypothetical protein
MPEYVFFPPGIDTNPLPLDHRSEKGCECGWCSFVRRLHARGEVKVRRILDQQASTAVA